MLRNFSFPGLVLLIALSLTPSRPLRAQIAFTDQSVLLANSNLKGSVAVGVVDLNGDGKDDLIRFDHAVDLEIEYQQAPGAPFTRLDYGPVSAHDGWEWCVCAADIDANGFNDILVGNITDSPQSPREIKILTANDTGTHYTRTVLPDADFVVQTSNFVDIDNDGFIDIFVCNDDAENYKFRGLGAGAFVRDESLIDTRGVPSSPPASEDNSGNYATLWTDYDNDGDLDLYLSKCRSGVTDPADPRRINLLFRNDGAGGFREVGAAANLRIGAQTWCTAFGDIDNDGDFDCFVVNHFTESRLFEDNGDGTFTDITAAAGFSAGDLDFFGIQAAFADFDNDGFVDLVTSTLGNNFFHRLFRNNGNGTFTHLANPFGTERIHSFALGDLNSDGFLDLHASYGNGFNSPSSTVSDKLWMNAGNENHHLAVRLTGTESNINGIGARVEIHGAWGIQIREVWSGQGYGTMHSFTQSFGLGAETAIDRVVVRWPSGTIDEIFCPAPDQVLSITEGSSPNPLVAWLDMHFTDAEQMNPSIGGLDADPDLDLKSTLVEYGLAHDPRSRAELSGVPDVLSSGAGPGQRLRLRCSLPEDPPANIVYEIEACPGLGEGTWSAIASRKGARPWTGPAVVTESAPSGGRVEVTVEDIADVTSGPTRFLRLALRLLAAPAD